ncbi:DUF1697 domain-containing protein [Glutamicibacter soli]|uniref:DUF1697 domain-containing protein n=1 Tax=Glutamicibacter soli TaxID=453836 RepID=A0A6L9FZT5_9MICC|nr:DUF1697 domain-containing protein [Glutamicibacter soli]NAZ15122.1 DUF1697 domain-containing protein [Glutamicibacter soli]
MTTFAVFLRGVNVGGVKVLMKDLASLLADGGFTEMRTLLASGNVILESELSEAQAVQRRCNELLEERYGRSIPTLVYTREEILQLAQPFVLELPEPAAEHHGYLTLCESAADAAELCELARGLDPQPAVDVLGRALCWIVRRGQSTTDPLAKLTTAQARKRVITTRNHNTLVKLAAIIR